jgi:hypothetical protein
VPANQEAKDSKYVCINLGKIKIHSSLVEAKGRWKTDTNRKVTLMKIEISVDGAHISLNEKNTIAEIEGLTTTIEILNPFLVSEEK